MELDVRSLFRSAKPTPDLERQPYRLAVQTAIRSLDLLLGDRRHGMDRAGIVGEGEGAAVALAVAAVRKDEVAFLCLHEPTDPTSPGLCSGLQAEACRAVNCNNKADDETNAYMNVQSLASLVRTPTLVSVGEDDTIATPGSVWQLYCALQAPKTLVQLRRAGHCQPSDLGQWQTVWHQWTSMECE
jgi:cephalosporin-C deacetylase-like acetyl esterase